MIIPFIENEYGKNKTNNEVALLYKQQISYSKEIIELSELFFKDKYTVDKEAKEFLKENKSDDVKKEFLNEMEKSKKLDIETIATMIKSVGATTEKKGKLLFMPIRIFVSGQTHGPDLKQTILLLGKDKIIKNLKG
jgi:nondiscriminating glutamyl-tRNA synthetase